MVMAMLLSLAATPTPTNEELYSAIWDDLRLNAMIGNGNLVVTWGWLFGHDDDRPPTLKIIDLACEGNGPTRTCTFDLSRMVHPAATDPAEIRELPLLTCVGQFRLEGEAKNLGWGVIHTPGNGHSRTTLQCAEKKTPTPAA